MTTDVEKEVPVSEDAANTPEVADEADVRVEEINTVHELGSGVANIEARLDLIRGGSARLGDYEQ